MYHVFGLVSGFVGFWFVVAALQTSDEAAAVRPYAVVGAVIFAALAAGLFWLGRRTATPGGQGQS
ncbi:MAG: hypothetical protein HY331_07205 [Chloroflexi bacterium]|nr:hypothetical protein [Chloroflexota bacterium]